MYDLIIKTGRVIDPVQDIDQSMDVAIKGEKIAALEKDIPARHGQEVILTEGKIVTPGLIDLHTHVYPGTNVFGLDADLLSEESGVTTFVDAGSAGPGNFRGFKEHVIDRSRARILAFLHIAWSGLSGTVYRPEDEVFHGELNDLSCVAANACTQVAKKYPDLILGFKVRAGFDAAGSQGIKPVRLAKEFAQQVGRPVMIHISFPPPSRSEILQLLESGDILTHAFRGSPNSPLDSQGSLLPEMFEARKRGVVIDIGHGGGSFSFDVAEKMIEEDFLPDVISSDIHALCIDVAVNLPTTMSKFLVLGMGLKEVVKATTTTPAAIINRPGLGSLREGTKADITVLESTKGDFLFTDGFGRTITSTSRLKSVVTISEGKLVSKSIS